MQDIFAMEANFYLMERMILNGTPVNEISSRIESIRKELVMDYVNYLTDNLRATEITPQFPTNSGIADFHDKTLKKYGAGDSAYGGYAAAWIPDFIFDPCPICVDKK